MSDQQSQSHGCEIRNRRDPVTVLGVPLSIGGIVALAVVAFTVFQTGITIRSDVSDLKDRVVKLEAQTEAVIRLSEQIKAVDARICRIEEYLRDIARSNASSKSDEDMQADDPGNMCWQEYPQGANIFQVREIRQHRRDAWKP